MEREKVVKSCKYAKSEKRERKNGERVGEEREESMSK